MPEPNIVGKVTLYDVGKMTDKQRKMVVSWLKSMAQFVQDDGKKFSARVTGRMHKSCLKLP